MELRPPPQPRKPPYSGKAKVFFLGGRGGGYYRRTILTARNQNIFEAPDLKCHQGYTWEVPGPPSNTPMGGGAKLGIWGLNEGSILMSLTPMV